MDLAASLVLVNFPGPEGLGHSRVREVTGKEFGGQSAAPPPLAASKTEGFLPSQHSLPRSPRLCRDGGSGVEPPDAWRRTPKNSCQQCGSQSGFGWKAWAGGLSSPQHLGSTVSAVATVTHATPLDSGLSLVKAMGWISPCLHQSPCPANSIPPPIPGMTLPAQGPE